MAVAVHGAAGLVVPGLAASDNVVRGSKAQWRQVGSVSSSWQTGSSHLKVSSAVRRHNQQRSSLLVVRAAAGDGGVEVETEVEVQAVEALLPSSEWPENFSLLNFEDLISHYEPALFKEGAQPGTFVGEVMSKTLLTAFPDQTLSEVSHFFNDISGFPVIDEGFKPLGVVSKKDWAKAVMNGENPKVKDVMSAPAITLFADKTVQHAAVLMLKNKIHRIPIVNYELQVVGIVTRTDIFTALDSENSA